MNSFSQQLLEQRGYRKQPDGSWSKDVPLVVPSPALRKHLSAKEPKVKQRSPLAVKFEEMWKSLGGPDLSPEFRFHKERKWRFDYCHERTRVAIELDGGIFSKGRHTTAKGFQGDCDKFNAAAEDGFYVFRLATGMVTQERVETIIRTIRRLSFT
jgi:very-short-patch-repair endonuclease